MDESRTTCGTPAASTAAAMVFVRRSLSTRTWLELKFGGRRTYTPSAPLKARSSVAPSSTSAIATSAPASPHAFPLAASCNTTRTFFFCRSNASATTLPVFPEAPSTTNIASLLKGNLDVIGDNPLRVDLAKTDGQTEVQLNVHSVRFRPSTTHHGRDEGHICTGSDGHLADVKNHGITRPGEELLPSPPVRLEAL